MPVMVALGEDYPELREAVGKICERYPGAYWRKLEAEQAYPTEFITELTQSGFLASLTPEEYGGPRLPSRPGAASPRQTNPPCSTASPRPGPLSPPGPSRRAGRAGPTQPHLPTL